MLLVRERELLQLRQEYNNWRTWANRIQKCMGLLSTLVDIEQALLEIGRALITDFPYEVAAISQGERLLLFGLQIGQTDEALLRRFARKARDHRDIVIISPERCAQSKEENLLSWGMAGPVKVFDREQGEFVLLVGRTARTVGYYSLAQEQEPALFRSLLDALSHTFAAVRFRADLVAEHNNLRQQIEKAKQAEQALAEEKERLSVTLRSICDGVITTDEGGGIVSINRAAEELIGRSQQEAIGQPLHKLLAVQEQKEQQSDTDLVGEILQQGGAGLLEKTVLLPTIAGNERILSVSGAPIRDRNSTIIGVVFVLRDVTEQLKIEEERLRASKLKSIGLLAGGIAHDFNNILTAVVGNLSLVKLTMNISAEDKEVIEDIEVALRKAKDLTTQLLTFAKGGAPILKTASIAEVIKESAAFVLRGSNVRCHFVLPENLWLGEIDRGQISQVIQNLIINANQAMPDGGTIDLCAENLIAPPREIVLPVGRYVRISIRDNGTGIPDQHLTKIFDPYFTTKQKGSGLGLATAYSIITNHRGKITVQSTLGQGTTFQVYLPASAEQAVSVVTPVAVTPHPGAGRVLVMDDEPAVRKVLGSLLHTLGYEVEFAEDGQQALALYRQGKEQGQPFVVVIMDLTIPGGMGGKETIKHLLAYDAVAQVIVSSGYSNDPIMAHYREYGFKGVISKPYDLEALSRILRQIIFPPRA